MKPRFETMDKLALVVAAILIIGGFAGLLRPDDFVVMHAPIRGKGVPSFAVFEQITPSTARIYGLCAVIVGSAIAGFVVWAARSE